MINVQKSSGHGAPFYITERIQFQDFQWRVVVMGQVGTVAMFRDYDSAADYAEQLNQEGR